MRRFLIVGNQTLGSEQLRAAVRERLDDGPCRFHIVVPATPPREHFAWSEGEAVTVARRRLDEALAWMEEEGATVTGAVGDASPALAVADAVERADLRRDHRLHVAVRAVAVDPSGSPSPAGAPDRTPHRSCRRRASPIRR